MKKICLMLTLAFLSTAYGTSIYMQDDLYGLKGSDGKAITKPVYQKIVQLQYTPTKAVLIPMQATKKTNVIVTDNFKAKKGNKWGVIDKTGKTVCDFKYDDIKINDLGEISVVSKGKETMLNPFDNAMKKTGKTAQSIVGLPVTIVAGAMIPVEVLSKIGSKEE